jgi:hypothetical protein
MRLETATNGPLLETVPMVMAQHSRGRSDNGALNANHLIPFMARLRWPPPPKKPPTCEWGLIAN